VLDVGAGVIPPSDAGGGILTSAGAGAARQGTQGSVLTQAHHGATSNRSEMVLLTGGGFKWPIGSALGTHGLRAGAATMSRKSRRAVVALHGAVEAALSSC
jgi:hypothetical protein